MRTHNASDLNSTILAQYDLSPGIAFMDLERVD
jgi:hypothetical protein